MGAAIVWRQDWVPDGVESVDVCGVVFRDDRIGDDYVSVLRDGAADGMDCVERIIHDDGQCLQGSKGGYSSQPFG